MTPDRLRAFVSGKNPGRARLTLEHDTTAGFTVIAEWSRDDVKTEEQIGQVTRDLLEQAQGYADTEGESCKFLIRWFSGAGKVLGSAVHKCKPADDASNEGERLDIIRELLKTNTAMHKQSLDAQRVNLEQQSALITLLRQERDDARRNPTPTAPVTLTEAEQERIRVSAHAIDKLADLIPDLGNALLLAAGKFIGVDEDDDSKALS